MPLSSGLRAAGDLLTRAGVRPQVEIPTIGVNTRPEDPINHVDTMGNNATLLTGNPLFGGFGVDMTDEFQSSIDAKTRLNDLRTAGYY